MAELHFLISLALNAHFTAVFICLVSELSFIQRRSALTCSVFCWLFCHLSMERLYSESVGSLYYFWPSWILSETIWKLTWIVWADFPYQECPFFALLVLSDNFRSILVKIHTACHSSIILCLLIWAKSAERESGLKWTLSEQKSAGQNLKTLSIYFIGQRWLLSQELSNFQARNYLQNSFKYHLFALLTQPPLSVLQAC